MSTLTAVAETPVAVENFEEKLDRLAEVAVKSGLGLAPGQQLVMTASVDALPLVRRITEHAYKAGASLVTTLFTDDQSALLATMLTLSLGRRYRHEYGLVQAKWG